MTEKTKITTIEDAINYVELKLFNSCPGPSDEDPVWTEVKRLATVGAQAEKELEAFHAQFPHVESTEQNSNVIMSTEVLETVPGRTSDEVLANNSTRFSALANATNLPGLPASKQQQ